MIEKEKSSIKIIRMAAEDAASRGSALELCYSGGKDSDVMRVLCELANVPVDIIYKDTTIDFPGTHAHILRNGGRILRPKRTFLQHLSRRGLPSRWGRWCCEEFKEYKVHDVALVGVRREESAARSRRYTEPNRCVYYGSHGTQYASHWYPLLEWSTIDIAKFVRYHGIVLHPHYYDENGVFVPSRRLGCIGCPLRSDHGVGEFKQFPKFLLAWYRYLCVWFDNTKGSAPSVFPSAAHLLYFHLYYTNMKKWHNDGWDNVEELDILTVLGMEFGVDFGGGLLIGD